MTPSWGPTSVTIPPCLCRWAIPRVPTRAARSLAWAGRYMTPSTVHKAQWLTGLQGQWATARAQGRPRSTLHTTKRRQATEAPSLQSVSSRHCPIGNLGVFYIFILFFYVFKLRDCESQIQMLIGLGSLLGHTQVANFPAGLGPRRGGGEGQGETCAGRETGPQCFRLLLPLFSFLC